MKRRRRHGSCSKRSTVARDKWPKFKGLEGEANASSIPLV